MYSLAYLIKIENQIQLTNISKKLIQDFNKEMYCFEVGQLVVVCVYADTKEKASITSINDFGAAFKFDKVGLVLLVAWSNKPVNLRL